MSEHDPPGREKRERKKERESVCVCVCVHEKGVGGGGGRRRYGVQCMQRKRISTASFEASIARKCTVIRNTHTFAIAVCLLPSIIVAI